MSARQVRVLAFGTFDPLHEGHRYFFRQARRLGSYLLVIVARDSVIKAYKHRQPHSAQAARLRAVQAEPDVSEARLGGVAPQQYELLGRLDFDVLVLGYDQEPGDEAVRRELEVRDKKHVRVVRLRSYKPELYKSTRLRD